MVTGVISTATLRAGPESSSAKIGEHSKGTVIEVVQEMTTVSYTHLTLPTKA